MTERVGFIGLGIMGRGMAANLLKAGFDLTVWNRTSGRAEALVAQGANLVASPAELAAQCQVIISCVSDTPDVHALLLGDVLTSAQPGSLVIDMSTISPQGARVCAEALAARGIAFLDAPVSGGSEGAAKGTLSIMVGGAAEDVERARPYFEAMGKTITHVGRVGDGQTVKLVNQILVVGTMLAVSEALVFAQASGVDLERTLAAVSGGAAGSWMLTNRGPQCVNRDWRPGFTIDLQQKDLRLVLQAADQIGVPMLGTGMIFQLYRTLQADGLGEEGNHALIKAIERLAGVEVGGS
ncbi:NAD(P)-dependent oxidoreductase [Candidatus Chloroploca sp. M-50]|uniref:NAD(P)-dependent oxidoreductase n=1 Tax=Candidatus Chloroploca mongolica TaxID=2528176 RepID=A0ABS4DC74_9CHLR|nr:NAD(P)-dependent oxidoreductase [Candidatus Chloroploca mongolica]MBP1467041.1 NAD(P)-dependent oxidoreductase [Candidatus Chloroploca mongolica]